MGTIGFIFTFIIACACSFQDQVGNIVLIVFSVWFLIETIARIVWKIKDRKYERQHNV